MNAGALTRAAQGWPSRQPCVFLCNISVSQGFHDDNSRVELMSVPKTSCDEIIKMDSTKPRASAGLSVHMGTLCYPLLLLKFLIFF